MVETTPARILVVEDEVIISKDIQRSLKRLGYEVVGAAVSGAAALELAAATSPDLVLMDIHIKGEMDGIDTAQRMCERHRVPVIYLTAFADGPTLDRAKRTGPFAYLLKPFEERELGTAIEMALYKHQAERRLQENEERLARIVETNADAILITDAGGRITLANAAAERIFGLERGEITRRTHDDEAWRIATLSGEPVAPGALPCARVLLTGEAVYGVEYTVAHATGRRVVLSSNAAPLHDADGRLDGVVASITDVTERKAMEERLVHQALHDPLTGLPNRVLFLNRLEHALTRSERSDVSVCVMFLDLDNFNVINDSLGHAAGDQLLLAVAARLQKMLRAGDTVARFGGDEFTVLIDNIANPRYSLAVAERMLQALDEPFTIEGQKIHTATSIGIAFSRSASDHPQELLRHADTAMYEAKRKGKACWEVYREGMSTAALKRLELETELRRALDQGELTLHYQPTIRLEGGVTTGFEALARWNHPTRGPIPPGEFIPVAEECGLIVPLGRWILREACQQARAWHEQHPKEPPLSISVNVSARQLRGSGLVEDVAAALRETGLEPSSLVLEITETVAMEEAEATVRVLRALKALGVRLAIDDFGTGYSSMAYLRSFPIDFLKIDRRFVAGLHENSDEAAIVSSMISLSHALNLTAVAEGAETSEEVEELHRLGCDAVQGFYFAKPMAQRALEEYMQTRGRALVASPPAPVTGP